MTHCCRIDVLGVCLMQGHLIEHAKDEHVIFVAVRVMPFTFSAQEYVRTHSKFIWSSCLGVKSNNSLILEVRCSPNLAQFKASIVGENILVCFGNFCYRLTESEWHSYHSLPPSTITSNALWSMWRWVGGRSNNCSLPPIPHRSCYTQWTSPCWGLQGECNGQFWKCIKMSHTG